MRRIGIAVALLRCDDVVGLLVKLIGRESRNHVDRNVSPLPLVLAGN